MQLSASTTPSDPSLAALFAGAGRALPSDGAPLAPTGLTKDGAPFAFADLLSGAAPTGAQPSPAPALGGGAVVPSPMVSTTTANFPTWLTTPDLSAESVPTPAILSLGDDFAPPTKPGAVATVTLEEPEIGVSVVAGMLADSDQLPNVAGAGVLSPLPNQRAGGGMRAPVAVGRSQPSAPETPLESTPDSAPSTPSASAGSPPKVVRAAKSPAARATTAPASGTTSAPESADGVAVAVPAGAIADPAATGAAGSRAPRDEAAPTPEVEAEGEGENLPAALTPVASRKERKPSASRQTKSEDDDETTVPLPNLPPAASGAVFASQPEAGVDRPSAVTPRNFPRSDEARPLTASTSLPTRSFAPSGPEFGQPTPVLVRSGITAREAINQPADSFETDSNPAGSFSLPETVSPELHSLPAVSNQMGLERVLPENVLPDAAPVKEGMPSFDVPKNTADLQGQSTDEAPRVIQFESSIPTRAEIFAAFDGENLPTLKNASGAPEKTFLTSVGKRVTIRTSGLGIDAAKSETVMSTATLSNRPSFVAPPERATDVASSASAVAAGTMPAAEPALFAHRAVEAVMNVVERYSAGDRHSLSMKFSVGGADLSVRVEMRGDEVRTTFRTDSPELRNALAHEWQAAAPDVADRSVRIAAPVFSANNAPNFPSFSGDSASHQRDARSRRNEAEDLFSSVSSRSRAAAFGSSLEESPAHAAGAATASTALHLSTLA